MSVGKKIILLVDDEDDLRHAVAEMLRLDGYLVIEEDKAISALASMQAGLRPHVVLTDIHLAGMSGYKLINDMRADPLLANIPIVILSGDHLIKDAAKLANAAWLQKPFAREDLRAILLKVLPKSA